MRKFILCISFSMVLLGLVLPNIFAQTNAGPSKASGLYTDQAKAPAYPVILGGQALFSIKDVKGLSGTERAETISRRIKEIAEDSSIPADSIAVYDYEKPLTLVRAGDQVLLAVLDEEAKSEGKTRQELANERAYTLRKAVEKYRRDFGIRSIITEGLLILLATLAFVSLLIILNKLYHNYERMISAWMESKEFSIRIQKFEIIQAERISMFARVLAKVVRLVVLMILLYGYVYLILSLLPWTKGIADRLLAYIMDPLKLIGQAIWMQIPDLVVLAIIIMVTRYLLKFMRLYFMQIENERIKLNSFFPEWAEPTYKLCRILILFFAVVVAYPYIPGSTSQAFKGVSIFFGVLISLGSSSAIANIIAGYMLIYRRVFKIGDRVKIADFVGDVVAQKLQVVHLRTIKNEEITVPCSVIVHSHVINYSALAKENGLILHTCVTIGYDTPWRQVEALLLLAAERTPGLLRTSPPFILQTSLDDFYVSYELNVYIDLPREMMAIYSNLHRNIQDAFNEYGVQIMSPSYRGDPRKPKVVPKDQWYTPPARRPD